jgi:hypothetical protein
MPHFKCVFFLFLRGYVEFGSENHRGRKHISCEHTICFQKNWNLEIRIFYHVNSDIMWYFPEQCPSARLRRFCLACHLFAVPFAPLAGVTIQHVGRPGQSHVVE